MMTSETGERPAMRDIVLWISFIQGQLLAVSTESN